MGASRIPFTAICEYAKIYDVDDFDTFKYIINVMDQKVLEMSEKKPKDNNATK